MVAAAGSRALNQQGRCDRLAGVEHAKCPALPCSCSPDSIENSVPTSRIMMLKRRGLRPGRQGRRTESKPGKRAKAPTPAPLVVVPAHIDLPAIKKEAQVLAKTVPKDKEGRMSKQAMKARRQ